jgi:hypothetical protein
MKKLSITKTNPDWLEATWSDEENVVHCESFSGHKEHIEMFKAKCSEFGTELTEEDEVILAEVSEAYVYPTDKEIEAEELNKKLQECQAYLDATQFKFGDDYDLKDTPEWLDIKVKRQECREFIRINKSRVLK